MEPKLIISPSGKENNKVSEKSFRVPKNPSKSDIVTVENMLLIILFIIFDYCSTTASCTPYVSAISVIVPSA